RGDLAVPLGQVDAAASVPSSRVSSVIMSVRCWARAGWSCGGGILRSFGGWELRSVARPALRGSPTYRQEVPAAVGGRLVADVEGVDGVLRVVQLDLRDLAPVSGCPFDAV